MIRVRGYCADILIIFPIPHAPMTALFTMSLQIDLSFYQLYILNHAAMYHNENEQPNLMK
jgi:hypothetical protein